MLSYVWLLLISVSQLSYKWPCHFLSRRTNCGCLGDSNRPPGPEPRAPSSCQAGHQHARAVMPCPLSEHLGERRGRRQKPWGGSTLPDSPPHTPCTGPSFKARFTWVPFSWGPSSPPSRLFTLCPRHLPLLGLGSLGE